MLIATWKTLTKFTPYEALYCRPPPTLMQYIPKTGRVQAMEDTLFDRDKSIKLLKDHLNTAQNTMMFFADKKRSDWHFEVGDPVQTLTILTIFSNRCYALEIGSSILWTLPS